MSSCRTSVTEFFASTGDLPADAAEAGCATTDTQYCEAAGVAAGVITVQVKTEAGVDAGCTLQLDPNGPTGNETSAWEGSNNGCEANQVPANFR
ncbi:MAG: pilin [Alkalimonas sp.]|nr:pilin [Alkalimonas sp.]